MTDIEEENESYIAVTFMFEHNGVLIKRKIVWHNESVGDQTVAQRDCRRSDCSTMRVSAIRLQHNVRVGDQTVAQ